MIRNIAGVAWLAVDAWSALARMALTAALRAATRPALQRGLDR